MRDVEGDAPAVAAAMAAPVAAGGPPPGPYRAGAAEKAVDALSITAIVALSLRNIVRRRS